VFIATPVDPMLYLFPVLAAKVADKFRTHQDILEGYEVRRGGGFHPPTFHPSQRQILIKKLSKGKSQE